MTDPAPDAPPVSSSDSEGDTGEPRRPLWEVMRDAYEQSSGTVVGHLGTIELPGPDREEFAAMLRAIRDRLVPETPEPCLGATGTRDELQDWVDWNARYNIWWELTEEADRAEAGE